MAYEMKPDTGSLWMNERKQSDTHPDRTGSALIDGVEYWVNGWLKESTKGKYLSLAFKRKDAAREPSKPAPKQNYDRARAAAGAPRDTGTFEDDSTIPF
jgi:hypothetical protein